jgi:hypothetical protein
VIVAILNTEDGGAEHSKKYLVSAIHIPIRIIVRGHYREIINYIMALNFRFIK